jgi:hypothetical protein
MVQFSADHTFEMFTRFDRGFVEKNSIRADLLRKSARQSLGMTRCVVTVVADEREWQKVGHRLTAA